MGNIKTVTYYDESIYYEPAITVDSFGDPWVVNRTYDGTIYEEKANVARWDSIDKKWVDMGLILDTQNEGKL